MLASRNEGKIRELRERLSESGITVETLAGYPDLTMPLEIGRTFLENALLKARHIAENTGEVALADDSGLEVEALNGAPGVYSARYAGPGADDRANIEKVLREMRGIPLSGRKASFYCVLVLCWPDGSYRSFDGRWEGVIAEAPLGEGGFGYDPIFLIPDLGLTAAQIPFELKNRISHRAKALARLEQWVNEETGRSAVR